jgi:hypothetical protein
MKRFHVHVAVTNISASVEFYSKLFGQLPTTEREDYAKWMLDDPRLNFAISARGHATGVNHLGFQAETPEELQALKRSADSASNAGTLNQEGSACCYAKSDKYWTLDPQGLAWEHFHTTSEAPEFGNDTANQAGACCIPVRGSPSDEAEASQACCVPKAGAAASESCCG